MAVKAMRMPAGMATAPMAQNQLKSILWNRFGIKLEKGQM
jgi:hypothetical protein